jgi:hypothetical protein
MDGVWSIRRSAKLNEKVVWAAERLEMTPTEFIRQAVREKCDKVRADYVVAQPTPTAEVTQ